MKQSDWKRISTPLAERLPQFRRVGRGFIRESEWTAVGIFMDESREKGQFYLEAFILPLFVPTEHIYFNYGERLRDPSGAQTWSLFDEHLLTLLTSAVNDLQRPNPLQRLRSMIEARSLTVLDLEIALCATLLEDDADTYKSYVRMVHDWSAPDELTVRILKRCQRVIDIADLGGREAALTLFSDRRENLRHLLV